MTLEGTTIIGVRKDGQTVIAGDGQVTQNQQVIMKGNAKKVRRVYNNSVILGFAGSVADAFMLSERFEEMLNKYSGNLMRAAVELAMLWRGDRNLRQLEALMIVADKKDMFIVSGSGEVIEPEHGVCAIGSGGNYALAAGRALIEHTDMTAEQVAREAMKIASDICIFTNSNIVVEVA
ncbi:MAG: ATP-dependent protease subunit HslV [Clostridiales bacterium]|nr:ATP-dependent protease subunit HslV [Clostridiales bacterium]